MPKKKTDMGKDAGMFEVRAGTGVYSAEALKLAAFVFVDRGIKLSFKKNLAGISVKSPEGERILKEFMNEALNQQCRMDLTEKNGKSAKIIITRAMLSALGK